MTRPTRDGIEIYVCVEGASCGNWHSATTRHSLKNQGQWLYGHASLRALPGDIPNTRLKARLNEASD